jgi:uncharacterized protein with HEPN domain
VTQSVDHLVQVILDAIGRTRVADRRMRLAQSLVDDVGVQLAFQAILHNLSVIAEAVTALPPDLLERDPKTPWDEYAAMRDLIAPTYHHIVPEAVHRTLEPVLDPLDVAVRRLRAAQ